MIGDFYTSTYQTYIAKFAIDIKSSYYLGAEGNGFNVKKR